MNGNLTYWSEGLGGEVAVPDQRPRSLAGEWAELQRLMNELGRVIVDELTPIYRAVAAWFATPTAQALAAALEARQRRAHALRRWSDPEAYWLAYDRKRAHSSKRWTRRYATPSDNGED